jgi:hypothetical protein
MTRQPRLGVARMTRRSASFDAGKSASGGRLSWGWAMNHNKWYMLVAGDYVMTTWDGESQRTYRATWRDSRWNLTRRVAGASATLELASVATLQEAMAEAKLDAAQVL